MLSKDAAETRVKADARTKPPRYAIRTIDAETIEVDWVLSPKNEGATTAIVNSDHFTFGGALWNLRMRRFVDSEHVGFFMMRGKSAYPDIVVSSNFSLIQQNVDAPPKTLKGKNYVETFETDFKGWGSKFCTKTEYDTRLQESSALIFRARIRLATGIIYFHETIDDEMSKYAVKDWIL